MQSLPSVNPTFKLFTSIKASTTSGSLTMTHVGDWFESELIFSWAISVPAVETKTILRFDKSKIHVFIALV